MKRYRLYIVLANGIPANRISDLQRVDWLIKGGELVSLNSTKQNLEKWKTALKISNLGLNIS